MSDNAKKYAAGDTVKKDEGGLWETIKVIIQALLIAVLVRTVLFQPFNIPSGSLIPTLLIGDYLFVSKYSYGYSKHSIPFSPPLFNGRIFGSQPKRGDIAVFKLPKDNSTDYIKRVIGLPGDKIQVIGGVLHINGKAGPARAGRGFQDHGSLWPHGGGAALQGNLPEGTSHDVIERDADRGYWDNTEVYTVKPDHFFMMGDNRDNSTDSRDEAECRRGAFRELRRPGGGHLLLHRREFVLLASLGMADAHPLEPHVRADPLDPCPGARRLSTSSPERLEYAFRNPELLDEALTHVSAPQARGKSYQRLEFLGDRVLGLAIRELLFRTFPAAPEGELSRRLAELVRRESCAEVAQSLGRRPASRRSAAGEATAGERRNPAILADVCEVDHRRGFHRWRL